MNEEDSQAPINTENCGIERERKMNPWEKATFIYNWNRSVNRIRKYCGMPPLPGTRFEEDL